MKHSILLLLSLFIGSMLLSCEDEPANTFENDCPEAIGCTEIFVMVALQIKNPEGENIILDSATVKNHYTNEEKEAQHNYQPNLYSTYVIADDSDLEVISTSGTDFTFTGWLNGEMIITESFKISHDCCHLQRLEGPEEIVLDMDANPACPDNLACTEYFKTIGVFVKDVDGNDIILDSTVVKNTKTGSVDSASHQYNPGVYSSYKIADDLDIESLSRSGTEIEFRGWKHGVQLFDYTYVIGHDCCHIDLMVGSDTLILDGNDCLQREWCHLVDCAMTVPIQISVKDKNSNPVALDRTEVCARFISECRVAEYSDGSGYTIVQTEEFNEVACRGTKVNFSGWIGDEQVVDQEFVVGKDCCTMSILEGPENISIN